MRERASVFLLCLSVAMLAALLFFVVERDALRPRERPGDLPALAEWLRDYPADWQAASAITERALDLRSETRFTLWRRAWRLTQMLAPYRPQAAAAFVRSGFFHWYELSPEDRRRVLLAATPLLRDRDQFFVTISPVWQLTGDMSFLRRANPGTPAALAVLRDLAAMNGLFADYGELREEARQSRFEELSSSLHSLSPAEIIQRLPPDFDQRDEPLLKLVLEELRRRPLDMNPDRGDTLERLIGYALRHNLEPLAGLEQVVTGEGWASESARLRLNAKMRGQPDPGDPASGEWRGLCGTDVCTSAHRSMPVDAPTFALPVMVVQTDEIPPYIVVSVDDVPVVEAALQGQAALPVPIAVSGTHHIEVRLINPLTRNLLRRRVRIL